MGLFGAAHGCGVKRSPLSKICNTYPKMMKLGTVVPPYLKRIQKVYESLDKNPLVLLTSAFFSPEISTFCYLRNSDVDAFSYIIFNAFTFFFESLKIVLMNMATILMSAKMATLGLLRIKVF